MTIFKTNLILLSLLSYCALAFSASPISSPEVKETEDLRKVAKLSKNRALPIMMVFSSSHCGYCEILENEFLRPMLLSGEYQNKIIIRKIVLDEVGALRDFQGKLIGSADLESRYNISITPTIIFFDHQGKELAKRMIGVGTIDFFGGYLDNAIDKSVLLYNQNRKKLKLSFKQR